MNNESTQQQQQKTTAEDVITAFQQSGKTARSPVVQQGTPFRNCTQQTLANPPPLSEAEIGPTPAISDTPTAQQQQQGRLMTPTQVFIAKMRADEEAAVADCRRVLRKIKAAMMKQRNISMEPKKLHVKTQIWRRPQQARELRTRYLQASE
ncbi:hypothetical protein ACLKA6_001154 [Drosophila palustris]